MRALGFRAKKAEVKDLFQLYERDEEEGLEFFEFREISKLLCEAKQTETDIDESK